MLDFVGQLGFAEMTARATIVLLAVVLGRMLLTRASAATRHLVQVLGIAAVLALPLAVVGLPSLDLPVLPGSAEGASAAARVERAPAPASVPLEVLMTLDEARRSQPVSSTAGGSLSSPRSEAALAGGGANRIAWLPLLWFVGVLAVGARSAIGWLRMRRLSASARPVDSPRIVAATVDCRDRLGLTSWPRMLIGREIRVPMLWGFFRPTLLLPAEAREWSEDRLRVVLLHELAHLRRADGLTLLIGRLATALHWFNPLAWIVELGARRDCERACDDVVLECGERPSEYARHLLAIARGLPSTRRPQQAAALAIVGRSHFEGRVRSILHPRLRRGLGRRGAVAAFTGVVLFLAFVSSARLVADEPQEPPAQERSEFVVEQPQAQEPSELVLEEPRELADGEFIVAQNHRHHGEKRKIRIRHGEDASDAEPGEKAFSRAYSLHSAERFEEAIAAFEEAIDKGYRVSTSMYNIACGYARLGNAPEAVGWLESALDEGFDGTDYFFEDSDLDPIRGTSAFRSLLKHVAAEDDSGESDLRRDNLETATLRYDALVERDSENGDAWYEVGSALLSLRDLDRSIDALERAERYLGTGNQKALYNMACALSLQGRTKQALDVLERAVLAGFGSEERFENDSDLEAIRGTSRFAEIAELSRKLSLDRFRGGHGRDYSKSRWAPAIEEFTEFTRDNPDVGRGWFNLGWALHFSGRHAEAVDAFRQAADFDFRRATASYNVACAQAKAGKADAALVWLERAVDAGFASGGHMASDDDLESLHGNPRFEEMVERLGGDRDGDFKMKIKRKIREILGDDDSI